MCARHALPGCKLLAGSVQREAAQLGSSLPSVPVVYGGVVEEYHWLTD